MKYSPLFLFENFIFSTKSYKDSYLFKNRKVRLFGGVLFVIYIQYAQDTKNNQLKIKIAEENKRLRIIKQLEI